MIKILWLKKKSVNKKYNTILSEALMKYKSDGFIYPYTHEEDQKMIHNTEKQLAYDEGVDAGNNQRK